MYTYQITFMINFIFRDHVEWTEEEKEDAQQKAKENSSIRIPLKEQGGSIFL